MSILTMPPFWLLGAPRSGTTFLTRVLDTHPGVFLTDETRVMTFMNRMYNRLAREESVLQHHRELLWDILEEEIPRIVERFYLEQGAAPGQRWGDKHPHYADPNTDPECLDLIEQLFPGSQYIHLVRDGRAVAASIEAKGWANRAASVEGWRRQVVHARTFGTRVGLDRYLEIRYEDLVADPFDVVETVLDFLGLAMAAELEQMLAQEVAAPTPFSGPTTEPPRLGQPLPARAFDGRDWADANRRLADLLVELRYETVAWRRQVLGLDPPGARVARPALSERNAQSSGGATPRYE